MTIKALEIYPENTRCIQGCYHCPFSKGIDTGGVVSETQQEVIALTLAGFQSIPGESHLNLSGDIRKYQGKLVDFTQLRLDAIYFNMGALSGFTQDVMNDSLEAFNGLIPDAKRQVMLSADLHLDTPISGKIGVDIDDIIGQYRKLISSGDISLSDSNTACLSFTRNNMGKKEFEELDISCVAGELSNGLVMESGLRGKSVDMGVSGISKRASILRDYDNGFVLDTRFRAISSIVGNKKTFEEFMTKLLKNPFLVTVFPDRVMVYHGADTIHIKELFFSHQEFMDILVTTLNEKKNFREVIDKILLDRLKKSQS